MQFIAHVQGEALATSTAVGLLLKRVGDVWKCLPTSRWSKERPAARPMRSTLKSVGGEDDESVRWAAIQILPQVALAGCDGCAGYLSGIICVPEWPSG